MKDIPYYGKMANISIDVPFSWCQHCKALEIEETKLYTGGTEHITLRKCEHAKECVECEKARRQEHDNQNQ